MSVKGSGKEMETAYPQRRLLYLAELDAAHPGKYNSRLSIDMGREVDLEKLGRAVDALIVRHEMLRTTFHIDNDQLVQKVHAPFNYKINCAAAPDSRKEVSLFDPGQLPLFNIVLEKWDNGYQLSIDKLLLLADRLSDNILATELTALYTGLPLPDIRRRYTDFTAYQNHLLQGKEAKDIRQFWVNSFTQEIEAVHIPPETDNDGGIPEAIYELEGEDYACFKTACARHGLETPPFLLASFYALLHRYSGSEAIVVSCTLPGRVGEEFRHTCGYFENIIPVKKHIDGDDLFYEFYESVQESYHLLTTYQEVPFDTAVEQLRAHPSLRPDDLFNIGFGYMETPAATRRQGRPLFTNDLFLTCHETVGSGISLRLSGNPAIFGSQLINRFMTYYRQILHSMSTAPETPVSGIPVVPAAEKTLLLQTFNAFEYEFHVADPIHVVFEDMAYRNPEQTAIYHNGIIITYKALNSQSNQLAGLLREIGITSNTFVGYYGDRDPLLVVALMGILKAGGVYIPFDINNPEERTKNLFADSQTSFLITTAGLLSAQTAIFAGLPRLRYIICLEDMGGERVVIENQLGLRIFDRSFFAAKSTGNPANTVRVDDWAYMLYTSGSTGEPKGAITRHNGALNHILAEYKDLQLPAGFSFLQSANISSDISVWQILAPLLKGGCVVIIDQDDLLNYEKLNGLLKERAVTIIEFVPSFLIGWIDYLEENRAMLPALPALQWIMMVGEEVPPALVNRWFDLYPGTRVLNGYGPCEASDDIAQFAMTVKLPPSRKKVPIGKPLANLNLFVLDRYGNISPQGAIGEICVSGVGVGAGYWNRPANTTKSFVPNPFAGTLGTTIYKTGDLGRWLADGNLEFHGRIDSQVKIRGFRVETGEIEVIIKTHAAVMEAVVAVRENETGEKSLLTFVTLKNPRTTDGAGKILREELHALCRKMLPSYMIPAQFRIVDHIALNLSSKIDRKKLLEMADMPVEEETYIPPSNDIQLALLELWKTVLNKEKIGIRDNFFMIGGHSLKATQIMSKVFRIWSVNLRLIEIFNNPTIEALALLIAGSATERLRNIEPSEEQDYYSLSHAQQRLWILNSYKEEQTSYIISSAYRLSGAVDADAFDRVFEMLIERHESLRTSFLSWNGRPVQKVLAPSDIRFGVNHLDLCDDKDAEKKVRQMATQEISLPFDLQKAPLLRATLIRLKSDEWIFLLTIHHIISDGWSTEVLQNEFFILYDAVRRGQDHPLSSLPLQYKDFVKWHNSLDFSKEEKYWLKQLSGGYSLINLPYDMDKGGYMAACANGALVHGRLDSFLLQDLKRIAAGNNTSLSNVFFAVFNILLCNISGQQDLPVGVAVANRNHPDTESLIGFFVNVMVILTRFNEDIPFADFLKQIAADMAEAYDYQNYPFDMLVNRLNPSRNDTSQPLFNVMYAFQNYADLSLTTELANGADGIHAPHSDHFIIQPLENEGKTSKFDLTLFVFDYGETVHLSIEYNTGLFEETTIKNILDSYLEFLSYAATPHMAESY